MKLFLLTLIATTIGSLTAGEPVPALKVLFVGSSQMISWDLPGTIKLMSESVPPSNPRIEPGKALMSGGTLKKHWDAGTIEKSARGMIAKQHWDFVVVQELFAGKEPEFDEYAAKFAEEIKKAGSQMVLFATANVTEFYNPGFTYPDCFRTLNDMQIQFGKKNGIPVAAAGYAWMKYLGPNPSVEQRLDLYHKDRGHPSYKGSYLYACLLYAVITQRNPEGLTNEFPSIRGGFVIPKNEATQMQKAAWNDQYQESVKQ